MIEIDNNLKDLEDAILAVKTLLNLKDPALNASEFSEYTEKLLGYSHAEPVASLAIEATQVFAEILEDPDSRLVPCKTLRNASSTTGESAYSEYIAHTLSASGQPFSGYTFLSPLNIEFASGFESGWKKDPSSGRSFHYPLKSVKEHTFISKGGDLYNGNSIVIPSKGAQSDVFWGSEFADSLVHEYQIAFLLQEASIRIQDRPTFAPMPIQVSELTHALSSDQQVVTYKDFLLEAAKDPRFGAQIFYESCKLRGLEAGPELEAFKLEIARGPEPIVKAWLQDGAPHGSYQYLLQGVNTRVWDVLRSPVEESSKLLSKLYSGQSSNIEIATEFIRRLAETHGILHGLGLGFINGSECLLIDTTVGGSSVDLGNLNRRAPEDEGYLNRLVELRSLSLYFYTHIVEESLSTDPNFEEFHKLFDKTFYCEYRRCGELASELHSDTESKKLHRQGLLNFIKNATNFFNKDLQPLRINFYDHQKKDFNKTEHPLNQTLKNLF